MDDNNNNNHRSHHKDIAHGTLAKAGNHMDTENTISTKKIK